MSAELHRAELEVVLRDQFGNIGYGNVAPTNDDLLRELEITDEMRQRGVKAYEIEFPCNCGPEYSERGLVSPHCEHHDGEHVVNAVLAAALTKEEALIGEEEE